MVIDHLGSEYSVRIHFASFWSNTHSEWIVDRHAGQLLRCDVIITLHLNVIVILLLTTGKRFEQRTSGLDYSRLTSVVTRRTSAVFGVKTVDPVLFSDFRRWCDRWPAGGNCRCPVAK